MTGGTLDRAAAFGTQRPEYGPAALVRHSTRSWGTGPAYSPSPKTGVAAAAMARTCSPITTQQAPPDNASGSQPLGRTIAALTVTAESWGLRRGFHRSSPAANVAMNRTTDPSR